MNQAALIARVMHQLPDLKQLQESLDEDIAVFIDQSFPPLPSDPTQEGEGLEAIRPPAAKLPTRSQKEKELQTLLDAGKRAIEKISRAGVDADLDAEEADGLEAITYVSGRPTLLIRNGNLHTPPPRQWEILKKVRNNIKEICQSVGRIEIYGHPDLPYAGTGFLVAEDIIMTNRHVAEYFCKPKRRPKVFKSTITPSIDYLKEIDNPTSAEFELTEVIGTHAKADLALFRISRRSTSGQLAPKPLRLASQPSHVREGSQVYVIGYPMWDGHTESPSLIERLFPGPHGLKRLQPGEVLDIFEDDHEITHDCSTLTGNSGSCLIDLQTHQVLGVHFRGIPRQPNHAVALWTLRSDPLLRRANVYFE